MLSIVAQFYFVAEPMDPRLHDEYQKHREAFTITVLVAVANCILVRAVA